MVRAIFDDEKINMGCGVAVVRLYILYCAIGEQKRQSKKTRVRKTENETVRDDEEML